MNFMENALYKCIIIIIIIIKSRLRFNRERPMLILIH